MPRTALFAALILAACPRPEPLPLPKPEPLRPEVHIPQGCAANLAGVFSHSDDESYVYQGRDDGGVLELDAYRVFAETLPDGGPRALGPLAPTARIRLERTPQGFVGEATADVLHPTGRICASRYPAEVTGCGDGGLVLRAAAAVSLGDGCQTPLPPRSPVMLEHRLARADAGRLRPGTTP